MTAAADQPALPLELWGGVECTVNRVRDRWLDQTVRTGHDGRLDDLDRFAGLGLSALRYPALWERIAPLSLESPDWSWTDSRLAHIQKVGIRPILGLIHHGSGPGYTSLLDPRFPELLARFAGMVAERYPWVMDYTPVNEPLTTARFSALYGLWFPHERNDRSFARALMQQCVGIGHAMRAIRAVNPSARLVQTEDCGDISGTPAVRAQVEHEGHRRWLTWDLLTGRVRRGHPLFDYLVASGIEPWELKALCDRPCAPDLLGLNYYLTSDRHLDDRLERYPPSSRGDNGHVRYADVEAVRAREDGITGHEAHLLAAWARYGIPVAVTEAHLACTREEQARWMLEAWTGAQWARGSGADVRAVTAWALLGAYDWNSLVTRDAGHYEPGVYDVRAAEPRPTFLVPMLQSLAAGTLPSHPIFEDPGWWRRSDRVTSSLFTGAPVPKGRPVLVMGPMAGLAAEFERNCRSRGIAVATAHDAELDITDPRRLEALLVRVRPWVVVNLIGFGRIDDSERDPDRGRLLTVSGASRLAAACLRHGATLLEFSSDLVFDGEAARAYCETDAPAPRNVYGRHQVEAEARVLEAMPDALIIRTGPRFGSRADGNFVARVRETLGAGRRLIAARDTVVSPTYDRDLVNAALDLVIDGERGIWHLANVGAVNWFELARSVATACHLPTNLIEAAGAADAWPAAVRPRYSALASIRGNVMRPLNEALEACIVDARHGHQARDAAPAHAAPGLSCR